MAYCSPIALGHLCTEAISAVLNLNSQAGEDTAPVYPKLGGIILATMGVTEFIPLIEAWI